MRRILEKAAKRSGVALGVRADNSFYCGVDEFREYADRPAKLVLENFYERMRRKHGILLAGDKPSGGHWNFDAENRKALLRAKSFETPPMFAARPDSLTQEVISMVEAEFPDAPGSLGEPGG